VRTGATNAGHTCYYQGKPYAMQQLGVGWVNPETRLVIGAGALIDPVILDRETAMVSEVTGQDVRKRLWVDYRAGMHWPIHGNRSASSGRHVKIGATGKGCSEALIDRIRGRGEGAQLFGQTKQANNYQTVDTEELLNDAWNVGALIQLEGTQGQGLDLYLGPYPYVTHKQTGPAQWMLEAGLSPSLPTEVTLVVRTFPIRVAGNSGPMRNEISWVILAGEINSKRRAARMAPIVQENSLMAWSEALDIAARNFNLPTGLNAHNQHQWTGLDRGTHDGALSNLNAMAWKLLPEAVQTDLRRLFELTTVTKKLRRIARFDQQQFAEAIRQTRPKRVALTFANYTDPTCWFDTAEATEATPIGQVDLVSYGPERHHVIDRRT